MNVRHGRVMQCFRQPLSPNDEAIVDSDCEAVSPPHVLVFLHGPGPGGVERIALRLITGWRRAGMDVRLMLGNPAGPMQHDLLPGAANQYLPPWPLIGRRLASLRLLIATLRAIDARPPDILFCAGNVYAIVAVLLKLRLGRRCPLLLAKVSNDLMRSDMPGIMRPFYRLWLRIQGKAIDHFAALSDPMAREVVARMGVDRAHVHVVPNPVLALADLDAVVPSPSSLPPQQGRRFVAVGRLERQKNYPLMLRAFAAGSGPDDRLTIFGQGRARFRLERLAERLGIAAKVRFAGFNANIRGQLPHHDVLLLSSRYEGQPGVVVEALACGLPIIATRCCASIAPLLDDGALGTLIDGGDEAAFANAIRTAHRDRQDRPRAREKSAAFTIERAVPAYRALFHHMLATPAHQQRATLARPRSQSPLEAPLS
ncbi:glycosyl transferase, putative [Sphingobium indicum BiD32]|uniref:Glycosyl transferase, putative n=2 Tax=Sphingobium indicum TaxID=332055 RepID=N1MLW5_9SPHN|nr:glycosyl transferase, putative [Sphingobium indicum BiD32]